MGRAAALYTAHHRVPVTPPTYVGGYWCVLFQLASLIPITPPPYVGGYGLSPFRAAFSTARSTLYVFFSPFSTPRIHATLALVFSSEPWHSMETAPLHLVL